MKDNNKILVSTHSIGFCGLLTIAFIVLKLCNAISWSWWWVLAPLWIAWGLALAIFLITMIIVLIIYFVNR